MSLHLRRWKNWGIGARLAFITFLPVAMLFITIVLHAYQSYLVEAKEELEENGLVISKALAESSEYSIVSGNFSDLQRIMSGLLEADKSISRIEIVDHNGVPIFQVASHIAEVADSVSIEAPIKKRTVTFNAFVDHGLPHISGSAETGSANADHGGADTRPGLHETEIGRVRVTMSRANMLAKQAQRFYVQAKIALLTFVVCGCLAMLLTRSLTTPLANSVAALREIRSGKEGVRIAVTTGGEIGELQASINEMSLRLFQATHNLENKILERTRDLEESRNEAVQADAEKRKLITKVNTLIEDERKSIAVEIHDEFNSSLIATRLTAERILLLAQHCSPTERAEEIVEKSKQIAAQIRQLYVSSRTIVRKLRPEVLDMLGLNGAIEEMVRSYNMTTPCSFVFDSDGDFSALDSGVSIAAYRIIQEALSNIIKHAQASKVTASLRLCSNEECLCISVKDNGVGFDTAKAPGMGILGMRERVFALRGTIDIHSEPGHGTTYSICIPL